MLSWGGAPYGGVLCDCVLLFFEGNSSDSCGRRHPQLPIPVVLLEVRQVNHAVN